MDAEPYRKIGRGGAGNFYSRQDVEELTNRAAKDIEAQTDLLTTTNAPEISIPRSEYINSGRGGAGNFRKGSNPTATTNPPPNPLSSHIPPSPSRPHAGSEMAYSGRGGAGNNRQAETKRAEAEALAKRDREQAHEELVRRVEMGLKVPERAHLVGERVS